jgi:hypothetical protein
MKKRIESLQSQSEILIEASEVLKKISRLAKEGKTAEATALRKYYKSRLEPMVKMLRKEEKKKRD